VGVVGVEFEQSFEPSFVLLEVDVVVEVPPFERLERIGRLVVGLARIGHRKPHEECDEGDDHDREDERHPHRATE